MTEPSEKASPAGQPGQHERNFVSGLGPVTALGPGTAELLGAFYSSDPLSAGMEPGTGQPHKRREVMRVPPFDIADYVKSKRPYLDPNSRFAIAACAMALQGSGIEEHFLVPSLSGLLTASMFGNVFTQEHFQRVVRKKGMRLASPMLFPHTFANATNSLIAIEFGLRGYNLNFCGGALCGAQAVEAAFRALKQGRADVMLAGGVDALSASLLAALEPNDTGQNVPPLSEGAGFLVLERESSLKARAGTPLCEVSAAVCCETGLRQPAEDESAVRQVTNALKGAIASALKAAAMWEGDVGAVFLVSASGISQAAAKAELEAIADFSQLPLLAAKEYLGETFAAAFPLECIAATLVLREDLVPPTLLLEGVRDGVEFWLEERPQPLCRDAALVLGCTPHLAAAAILKNVPED